MDAQTVPVRPLSRFMSMLLHVAQLSTEAIGSQAPTISTAAEIFQKLSNL